MHWAFVKISRSEITPYSCRARKALTDDIFGLIAKGETDEQRLVVCGLGYLKSLEVQAKAKKKKIHSHSESHLVELDDGTKLSIFPGDLDVTLNWRPDDDLKLVLINGDTSSHALISASDNSWVRVIPADESCRP